MSAVSIHNKQVLAAIDGSTTRADTRHLVIDLRPKVVGFVATYSLMPLIPSWVLRFPAKPGLHAGIYFAGSAEAAA